MTTESPAPRLAARSSIPTEPRGFYPPRFGAGVLLRERVMSEKRTVPAIPPVDYEGTVADWMVTLRQEGYWNGRTPEWYGDVLLTPDEWARVLEECEQ